MKRIIVVPTLFVASSLLSITCHAFVPPTTKTTVTPVAFAPRVPTGGAVLPPHKRHTLPSSSSSSSVKELPRVILYAKKKANAKAAALEALEALEVQADLLDAPLSKKEMKEMEKKQKKMNAKTAALKTLDALEEDGVLDQPLSKKEQRELLEKQQKEEKKLQKEESPVKVNGSVEHTNGEDVSKPMSKKEKMLAKALELEARESDMAAAAASPDDDTPQLSKKELKALKKQEEKMAAKAADKAAKKAQRAAELDEEKEINGALEGDEATGDMGSDVAEDVTVSDSNRVTLEDKIRRERPPPRIRVMEGAQPGFVSLRLENVGITFRNQEVLKDVTWGVQSGDRIGLVGKNGAGKTTQLRILAGELEPTTGDVVKSSGDLRTAMLRQEFVDELVPERTLKEEFMSVFEEENQILQDLKDVEQQLETMSGEDQDTMQEILDRMQDLQRKAEDKDVYVLESRVKKTMDLMGFSDDEVDDLVASFSGGWKMRIGLGKVLLKEPNILLLDEPTNHLDLDSVEWLEAFLRQQNIPMIIVSHDREFLDQVCTKIVDAEGGICTEYDGNYSRFLQLKKARMDSWQAAYDAQEKKIKAERQWMSKFKAKQPQQVKQRQEKLDKFMKSEEYVQKPPFTGKPFRFRFPDAPRLSPEVAEIKEMSHSYNNEISNNRLFDEVDLFIQKGDRIAVVGPNGSGKSTLLRLMIGREKPDQGTAKIVGANVEMSYFEQNQADALDLSKTVLETIQGASNGQSYNELRALLGQFLFKGDDVEKKVEFLSGGEKARLSLCCMMLRSANLLILDEPTNHLDIPAKEMLEEALQHFAGSVMVVSHDRYFISKVANSIVAIEDKKLVKYQGDYKFYMERSKEMREKIEARYVAGVERIEAAPVIDLEELTKPKRNFGGAKTASLVTRKDKGVKNAKRMRQT
ncbi:ABC transporter related protein [Nitzschia inconspicua]|uniref:ABC transporter related protein n=2 Tax=Nitzschia inconspicua TaxID=303405 RepID=A0A9K3PPY6_9STRA|nr:ABC transporter related protein [Nitzschia inconspicua]